MKKKIVLVVICVFLLTPVAVVLANRNPYGGTWSPQQTVALNAWQDAWGTSTFASQANAKVTSSPGWDLHVYARTMSSNPVARLATVNRTPLSNTITINTNNRTFHGDNNVARPGDWAPLQIRAAITQITNNQTIRLRFSAR